MVMVLGCSGAFGLAEVRLVNDRLARLEPAFEVLNALDLPSPSALLVVADFELLLSPFFTVDASEADSTRLKAVSSFFESDEDFAAGAIDGVDGTLPSATGSRPEVALTPRPAVRGVVTTDVGVSLPFSEARMFAPFSVLVAIVRRLMEVLDGVCSLSLRFGRACRAVDDGGGDLMRGDVGQDCVLFPTCRLRKLSVLPSTPFGCREGLCADRARCTAAAEGIVESVPLSVVLRVGLNSWLFFLDLDSCGIADALLEERGGEFSRGFNCSVEDSAVMEDSDSAPLF